MSNDLSAYKLNRRLKGVLEQFDKLADYNKSAGRPAFAAVRLYRADWLEIDKAIRAQSDNKYSIEKVYWRGLPLIENAGTVPGLTLTWG